MKLYAARAAVEVAMEAVQVYGGNGYMAEYQVEQLARDSKVLQIYAGTDEIQISAIARDLLSRCSHAPSSGFRTVRAGQGGNERAALASRRPFKLSGHFPDRRGPPRSRRQLALDRLRSRFEHAIAPFAWRGRREGAWRRWRRLRLASRGSSSWSREGAAPREARLHLLSWQPVRGELRARLRLWYCWRSYLGSRWVSCGSSNAPPQCRALQGPLQPPHRTSR